MKISAIIYFACFLGLFLNETFPSNHDRTFLFTSTDDVLGAACPDERCLDKTCDMTGCNGLHTPALPNFPNNHVCLADDDNDPNNNKCSRHSKTGFARCGFEEDFSEGFTCAETSVEGCATKWMGDKNDDDECVHESCSEPSGTCGLTRYACASSGCST